MSTATLYAAIRARLTDEWTACPVAWENESFTVPETVAGPQPWMMVEITGSQFQQQTIGAGSRDANRWREMGQMWIHVFAPTNTGSATARGLLHQAVDLFRGTELGTTTFLGASIGIGERAEVNGTWWRLSAAIDFERDA
jgi:hypothetical protein